MIISFADKETELLWRTGKNRHLPQDVAHRAMVKLQSLNAADAIERMELPPSNNLKKLGGDLNGLWRIWVNKQWRLVFHFRDGDAYDVALIDYH